MDAKDVKTLHKDLSYTMLGLAMQVHRELGFGFLEKEYENALMVLLGKESIKATQQAPILVSFRGEVVGAYYADILVEDKIIVELKSVDRITDVHRTRALNYLKATGMELAVILNFGKESLQYERLAY
jgi:GxxExxY protein